MKKVVLLICFILCACSTSHMSEKRRVLYEGKMTNEEYCAEKPEMCYKGMPW